MNDPIVDSLFRPTQFVSVTLRLRSGMHQVCLDHFISTRTFFLKARWKFSVIEHH